MVRLRIAAICIVLLALAHAAGAQTLAVDCTGNPQEGYLASQLAGVAPNTNVQITGMCLGNVTVTTDGLTFENAGGLQPVMQSGTEVGSDGIAGQLEIAGAHGLLVNGLTLQGAASDQPGVVVANLWLHDRAAATVQATAFVAAQRDGVLVAGGSSLAFQSGIVENIGIAGVAGADSDIQVENGATAILGFPNSDGTPLGAPAYEPCFGTCTYNTPPFEPWVDILPGIGTGITALRGGQVSAYEVEIEPQKSIIASQRAALHLEDVTANNVLLSAKSSAWVQNNQINGGMLILGGSGQFS